LKPRDAPSVDRLAQTFSMLGDYERSLELFKQAVLLAPRKPDYWVNLGYAQQYLGDLAGAANSYKRALAIDADFEAAYFPLVAISKQTAEQNFIGKLETLFAAAGDDVERSLRLGHSLSKSFEDLGQPVEALAWLDKAKAPRRRYRPYRPPRDQDMFAAAIATLPDGGLARREPPPSSRRHIFVVGLPRSGTTLTDRILQSHPEAVSLGEFEDMPQRVWQAAGGRRALGLCDGETFRRASSGDLARLGQGYLQAAALMGGSASCVIDKMPFNFLYAGLIHRALPHAKIVCLRRDPIDVCLSNYRQMFLPNSPFHDYAYDLCDIARYYVLFDNLIAHWRNSISADSFFELNYEALVADQEGETRRLLAFSGLDWDERCLAFYSDGAGVSTASAHQIRSPMFKSSIGRWRAYASQLEPMIEILKQAGLIARHGRLLRE
jgi:tetratricopeptide (TPR) repeat protein